MALRDLSAPVDTRVFKLPHSWPLAGQGRDTSWQAFGTGGGRPDFHNLASMGALSAQSVFGQPFSTTRAEAREIASSDREKGYPYTRRLLKLNALGAVVLFAATASLAAVGWDQAASVSLLGGSGFASLTATMSFRLLRLRR